MGLTNGSNVSGKRSRLTMVVTFANPLFFLAPKRTRVHRAPAGSCTCPAARACCRKGKAGFRPERSGVGPERRNGGGGWSGARRKAGVAARRAYGREGTLCKLWSFEIFLFVFFGYYHCMPYLRVFNESSSAFSALEHKIGKVSALEHKIEKDCVLSRGR